MRAEVPLRSVRDRFLALRALEGFRALDDEALLLLAEHSRVLRFSSGTEIVSEGRPLEAVHIVVDGEVTVYVRGVTLTRQARSIGFVSVLGRDPNGARAVAETAVRTLAVPVDVLLDAYEADFSFLRNALRNSARSIIARRRGLPADPDNPPAVELGTQYERPLTFVEKIMQVRQAPFLRQANLDAVTEFARSAREHNRKEGDLLFDRGDSPQFNLRIVYGRVRCTSSEGTSMDLGAGWVIGALDPFADLPRSYRAQALTDIIGFRTDREDFLNVLEGFPDLGMKILELFSKLILELTLAHHQPKG